MNGGTYNPGFNFALDVSPQTTAATGSVVSAIGFGNVAINVLGNGTGANSHYVNVNGNLNAGVNIGGIDNRVVATGAFNGTFGRFGKHNVVVADPGSVRGRRVDPAERSDDQKAGPWHQHQRLRRRGSGCGRSAEGGGAAHERFSVKPLGRPLGPLRRVKGPAETAPYLQKHWCAILGLNQ